MLLELVRDEDPSLVEERQRDDGLGDADALNSRRTRRPRVLLHELAVRGDRVVADGLDGGTAKVGAPMDVTSLADARFDWTQMKMHILERRDAILAHFIVAVVKEKAHWSVLRSLACSPATLGRQYPDLSLATVFYTGASEPCG